MGIAENFSCGPNCCCCQKSLRTALNSHIPRGKPPRSHLQFGPDLPSGFIKTAQPSCHPIDHSEGFPSCPHPNPRGGLSQAGQSPGVSWLCSSSCEGKQRSACPSSALASVKHTEDSFERSPVRHWVKMCLLMVWQEASDILDVDLLLLPSPL